MYSMKKTEKGSVLDVLSAGMCVLAMTVLMLAYSGNIGLMNQKAQINQIARKYILKMETVGCLTAQDRQALTAELSVLGVSDPDFSGSTVSKAEYGAPVYLKIKGHIYTENVKMNGDLFCAGIFSEQYEFEEYLVSTAKN